MAHKFRKRDLVTTTWVDGPEIARINATKAVSNREYMIHLLEYHLLRCRVDGILFMDGPKRQFAKYLELFGKIVKATLNVCEKIKEWRDQLHLTAKIKYEKTWKVKVGERPPFYWTYMKQNKGNRNLVWLTSHVVVSHGGVRPRLKEFCRQPSLCSGKALRPDSRGWT